MQEPMFWFLFLCFQFRTPRLTFSIGLRVLFPAFGKLCPLHRLKTRRYLQAQELAAHHQVITFKRPGSCDPSTMASNWLALFWSRKQNTTNSHPAYIVQLWPGFCTAIQPTQSYGVMDTTTQAPAPLQQRELLLPSCNHLRIANT